MKTFKFGKIWLRFDEKTFVSYLDEVFLPVSAIDITVFMSQLAVLYNAGIPVVRALRVLSSQWRNRRFSQVIEQIRQDIEGGEAISTSFSRFPRIFTPVETSVIRVGEAVGDMPVILERLALHRKRDMELQKRLQAAMTYPLTIFVFVMVLVFFLTQYLFQNMLPLFESQGIALPWLTSALVSLSAFLHRPLIMTLLVLLFLMTWPFIRFILLYPSIKARIDRFLWKIPLLGNTLKKLALARFCYHMSLLYQSGLSIMKVLTLSADVCGNMVMEDAIRRTAEGLKEGESLWMSFRNARFFPGTLVQMVNAGESAGKLPECLNKLADYYEMEVNCALDSFMAAIEPVMISVMGLFTGAIIFIMLSPLYNLIAGIRL